MRRGGPAQERVFGEHRHGLGRRGVKTKVGQSWERPLLHRRRDPLQQRNGEVIQIDFAHAVVLLECGDDVVGAFPASRLPVVPYLDGQERPDVQHLVHSRSGRAVDSQIETKRRRKDDPPPSPADMNERIPLFVFDGPLDQIETENF